MEPKKLAILRILELLQKESDIDHKLTQSDIIECLDIRYGIKMERKAVGNSLELLQDAGYDIEITRNGSYMNSRQFLDSELDFIIDCILGSRFIDARQAKEMIDHISKLSNIYFKSSEKNIKFNSGATGRKTSDFLYNIECISAAIFDNKKLTFTYNKYGADKKLHPTNEHIVTPLLKVMSNQHYYMLAYSEEHRDVRSYKIDHMTNVSISDEAGTARYRIKGFENGINYGKLASARPYMFTDESENITLLADEQTIDQIIDWFGMDIKISREKDNDGRYKVWLKASPKAMEYWALQYLEGAEIIEPASLREKIKKSLSYGIKKYK